MIQSDRRLPLSSRRIAALFWAIGAVLLTMVPTAAGSTPAGTITVASGTFRVTVPDGWTVVDDEEPNRFGERTLDLQYGRGTADVLTGVPAIGIEVADHPACEGMGAALINATIHVGGQIVRASHRVLPVYLGVEKEQLLVDQCNPLFHTIGGGSDNVPTKLDGRGTITLIYTADITTFRSHLGDVDALLASWEWLTTGPLLQRGSGECPSGACPEY